MLAVFSHDLNSQFCSVSSQMTKTGNSSLTVLYRYKKIHRVRLLSFMTAIFHLHLNSEGRSGTMDDITTSFLLFSLFSTALWDLANSRPVHSPRLSSHLFHCLPCFLHPFTMPCELVLAVPYEWETCPYHLSLRWSGGLYNGQEVFVWSDCLLDLGTDFLVGMRYILSWLPFGCVRLYPLCEYFEKMFDHSLLACSF